MKENILSLLKAQKYQEALKLIEANFDKIDEFDLELINIEVYNLLMENELKSEDLGPKLGQSVDSYLKSENELTPEKYFKSFLLTQKTWRDFFKDKEILTREDSYPFLKDISNITHFFTNQSLVFFKYLSAQEICDWSLKNWDQVLFERFDIVNRIFGLLNLDNLDSNQFEQFVAESKEFRTFIDSLIVLYFISDNLVIKYE